MDYTAVVLHNILLYKEQQVWMSQNTNKTIFDIVVLVLGHFWIGFWFSYSQKVISRICKNDANIKRFCEEK